MLISKPENILNNVSNILILRHDLIGDLLVSTQFITILRNTLPECEIDILLSNKNYSASNIISDKINNIFIYDKSIQSSLKLLMELRSNNYELIIDLFDNPSTTSNTIIKLVKPSLTLGFIHGDENKYDLNIEAPDRSTNHIINRINKLLYPFGINSNEIQAEVILENNKKINKILNIGIIQSGSGDSKYLGKEKIIDLLNKLNDKYPNFNYLLFESPGREMDSEFISNNSDVELIKKGKSIIDFKDSLIKADLIISPDTSAVHFASGLGIPCLAYYKVKDKKKYGMPWLPVNVPFEHIEIDKDVNNLDIDLLLDKFEQLILKIQGNENGNN